MAERPDPAPKPIHVLIGLVMADMPAVGKDEKAPAQMGGYSFRGIEGIVAALKPALAGHGVWFAPETLERVDTTRPVGGNKMMFCTDLKLMFTFRGPAGDEIRVGPVWGTGTDMGDKAVQKGYTAAEKTMLVQVFAIGDSATDAERHDVPDTERAAPVDWFKAHGWDNQAAHDVWRTILTESLKAAPEPIQGWFADARKAIGYEWSRPATRAEAQALSDLFEQATTPDAVPDESPAEAAGSPSPAPEAAPAASDGQSGETCLGCGELVDPKARKAGDKRASVTPDDEPWHAKCVPFPEDYPAPEAEPETLGDMIRG